MPFYVKVGKVPPKRHTTFYKEDGKSLYREELFSTKGFSGIYSNSRNFTSGNFNKPRNAAASSSASCK